MRMLEKLFMCKDTLRTGRRDRAHTAGKRLVVVKQSCY